MYICINNCQMVFQVRVLLFHVVLLRRCLSRPDLRPHFANMIERGGYGRKNFRISSSGAVYRIEQMVNVSIQILLCRVPSCEENLFKDRINWKFSCQCVKTRLPFRNFQVLHHQWRTNYFVVDTACCDAHPPPHSKHPHSMDRTINVEVRHPIFLNKKSPTYVLQICSGCFSDTLDATREKDRC